MSLKIASRWSVSACPKRRPQMFHYFSFRPNRQMKKLKQAGKKRLKQSIIDQRSSWLISSDCSEEGSNVWSSSNSFFNCSFSAVCLSSWSRVNKAAVTSLRHSGVFTFSGHLIRGPPVRDVTHWPVWKPAGFTGSWVFVSDWKWLVLFLWSCEPRTGSGDTSQLWGTMETTSR